MTIHYEILMDLWRNDVNEFLAQAAKLLCQDLLSSEEKDRVLELFVRSLPEDIVAKALANTGSDMRS